MIGLSAYGGAPDVALLPQQMDSNDAYRSVCKRLVALGLKQVRLADEIDRSAAWVSDWLSGKEDYDLKNRNSDRLDRYLNDIARALESRPAPRARHGKEPPHLERQAG
jgi:hypothetical protein